MAHLTKPTQYNIEDSNIALLGSDVSRPFEWLLSFLLNCPPSSLNIRPLSLRNKSGNTQETRSPHGRRQGKHWGFKFGGLRSSR